MGTNFLEGSVAIRQGVMAQSLHSPFRYLCTLIISPLGLLFSRLSSPSSLRLDLPYGRDIIFVALHQTFSSISLNLFLLDFFYKRWHTFGSLTMHGCFKSMYFQYVRVQWLAIPAFALLCFYQKLLFKWIKNVFCIKRRCASLFSVVKALVVGCIVMKICNFSNVFFWYKIKIHYFMPYATYILNYKTITKTCNMLWKCWLLDMYRVLVLFSC